MVVKNHIEAWKELVAFVNGQNIGAKVTIEDLKAITSKNGVFIGTARDYFQYLKRAGFISSIKRGLYRIEKYPDTNMTLKQCRDISGWRKNKLTQYY